MATDIYQVSLILFANITASRRCQTSPVKCDNSAAKEIIAYIKSKEVATYNLQTFNCTDFAIEAAQLAGINFRKTPGCWTGSSCGVSPANLGQDMIEMKFTTSTSANRISFSSMTQSSAGDGPCN